MKKKTSHSHNVSLFWPYVQIGPYITSRGGVVVADELTPYLDVPSSKSATVCFAASWLCTFYLPAGNSGLSGFLMSSVSKRSLPCVLRVSSSAAASASCFLGLGGSWEILLVSTAKQAAPLSINNPGHWGLSGLLMSRVGVTREDRNPWHPIVEAYRCSSRHLWTDLRTGPN